MKKARKKISLSKLAEKLGLSKSSVSRALSGSPGVSAKTAKAVAEAAKKFGYKRAPPFKGDVFRKERRRRRLRDNRLRQRKAGEGLLRQVQRDIQIRVGGERGRPPARIRRVRHMAARKKFHSRAKFEKLAAARGIRGGIVFGHYYRDSVPAEFRGAMGKLKLVSMGVKSNAPVKSSVFMDRFLMVRGFVERIMRGGYGRAGFIVERFADKCEDGKFTGGFFAAQFGRTASALFPRSIGKTPAGKNFQKSRNTRANTNSTRFSRIPPTSPK